MTATIAKMMMARWVPPPGSAIARSHAMTTVGAVTMNTAGIIATTTTTTTAATVTAMMTTTARIEAETSG
jgi:hypothetical protein